MTELLEHAIERLRSLPPETQDDLAGVLLELAGQDRILTPLTPDEEACLLESENAAARGEFATDQQVRDIWAKHGL